jgi:uncharacterized membrane protein YuzA (DUF378 family)
LQSALGEDRNWIVPAAILTVIELVVWLCAWSAGLAPVPLTATYLALAMVALGIALGLRPLWRRGEPRASWPVVLLGAFLVGVSSSLFMALKIAIPSLVPFWLDKPLAAAEAGLFGVEPYQLLDSLFGRATVLVDRVYGLWVPVQIIVLFSVMIAPASRAKTRALTANAAAWFLLGVVAATMLSSAGPIFFDRAFSGTHFAALHQILESHGASMVLSTADAMWLARFSDHPGLVAGISAVPSMHIAISLWILLVTREFAPRAVPLAAAYFAFIWIASVQLGWHYVTDGLVGVAGMASLWWLAGRLPYQSSSSSSS